jgi:acyl carrier protein
VGTQGSFTVVPISGTLAYIDGRNAWVMRGNSGQRLPLTANGKLDRRQLAAWLDQQASEPAGRVRSTPPHSDIEKRLAALWCEVLGLQQIGIDDNFFELGGDSIRGAILVNKIQQQLHCVVYVVALFEAPTVRQQIDYLRQHYGQAMAQLEGREGTDEGLENQERVGEADLRAFARLQLDAMDGRTDGDIANRQGVARTDRRFSTAHQACTHFQTTRRNDVATLAIGIAQQRNVGRAVGVVLNALHLGGDAIFVATEVDHAVVVLVTTALVTGGDVTVVVATCFLELRLQQRRVRIAFVQVITGDLDHGTAAG